MDVTELRELLDELDDRELTFHAFTREMRDYELVVYESPDPRSGFKPRHRRFAFEMCTEVAARSRVLPRVWARSTSEELLTTRDVGMDSVGYTWGTCCQNLYPGATLVEHSERAAYWERETGIPFHEVTIEASAHMLRIIFSRLVLTDLPMGYSPYVVEDGVAERYARGSKFFLNPDA